MAEATPYQPRWQAYFVLTKPRVVALMLLCALVGMLLAQDASTVISLQLVIVALLGIALVAGSAAVVNHVADAHIDAKMARTEDRPIPSGRLTTNQGLVFAAVLAVAGFLILFYLVNPLTAWLNLASWIGYAVVYTLWLKHATAQNIVIGGLFGAAPPLFGWTAVTGNIALEPILLVLIIFLWTPPHFWSLALARIEDYERSSVPMLPTTKGIVHTKWQILLYIVLLVLCTLVLPVLEFAGLLYIVLAIALGCFFIYLGVSMITRNDDTLYMFMFKYSILYLGLLFTALLADHYLELLI